MSESSEQSEYERLREENMRRNRERLLALQLHSARDKVAQIEAAAKAAKEAERPKPKKATKKKAKAKAKPQVQQPLRRSKRKRVQRSLSESELAFEQFEMLAQEEAKQSPAKKRKDEDDGLLSMAEYFALQRKDGDPEPFVVQPYSGWVSEEVQREYNLAGDAESAWEQNGGGKFSFRDPTGGTAQAAAVAQQRGWSKIRTLSSTMLYKNPNAFFYRHTAPGVEQHMGDWTQEEHDLFVETARKYGCGNKWGLFSTYIPHRVGYQCSNYYRQVILREGQLIDDNYCMSANGAPVYVGRRGGRS